MNLAVAATEQKPSSLGSQGTALLGEIAPDLFPLRLLLRTAGVGTFALARHRAGRFYALIWTIFVGFRAARFDARFCAAAARFPNAR
jgi:hypothetical protein